MIKRLFFTISCGVLSVAAATPALAQPWPKFEASVHAAIARSGEFDATDPGVGVLFGWKPVRSVGLEMEFTAYPTEFPDKGGFSASRFEFYGGGTIGPNFGPLRAFVKVRPGFLHFAGASEPFACIAIFPPPLACTLGGGRTMFAVDLGGGAELSAGRHAFARVDVGDRVLRYPGPSFDTNRVVHDDAFVSHDFRLTMGGGFRF